MAAGARASLLLSPARFLAVLAVLAVWGVLGLAALATLSSGCADTAGTPLLLDQSALEDPATCQRCHPDHFREWSGSMHAYAARDPVFLAMNARGQRETKGALGTFCVNCHAPIAVRQGLTKDGLNLASLPAQKKGVTCYFCHSVKEVAGTHDNPLELTTDGTLFGPFADPVASSPHRSAASPHFDETKPASAAMCGTCHDIITPMGAHLERTYGEWQSTLFAVPPRGLSCQACHMSGRDGPASTVSSVQRRLHSHTMAAIDLALEPGFPEQEAQKAAAQELLETTLQSTICLEQTTRTFQVVLENVGAGHGFPSGSSLDRRVWAEVVAKAGDNTLLATGQQRGAALVAGDDPDLWLLRDCAFDGAGKEKHMFWEAAAVTTNQLPGSVVMTLSDPTSFTRTHVARTFPASGGLPSVPDSIDLKIWVRPIGDDVIDDLAASGDLSPALKDALPLYQVQSAALTWTRAAATRVFDTASGVERLCVTTGKVATQVARGETFATCKAP